MGTAKKFYAVKHGREIGIFRDWATTQKSVTGFSSAVFKSFKTIEEANDYLGIGSSKKRSSSQSELQSSGNSKKLKVAVSLEPTTPNDRIVYCDGSALGNGTGGSAAGIGIWWLDSDLGISERLPGPLQTNNRAEMYAVARILEEDERTDRPLTICSDSEYTINVFSTWIHGWMKNGFKNGEGQEVKNKDLILYIYSLMKLRTGRIMFVKVKAHGQVFGNDKADTLAKAGARLAEIKERNYNRDTASNHRKLMERRTTEERAAQPEKVDLQLELNSCFGVEGDLLTAEELREMELAQNFD